MTKTVQNSKTDKAAAPSLEEPVALTPDELDKVAGGIAVNNPALDLGTVRGGTTTTGAMPPTKPISIKGSMT